MFCPKCGSQNSESGKYCRSCGTDLGNVSAALDGAGRHPAYLQDADLPTRSKKKDPTQLYGNAIRQILTGIGFLVVAVALLTTGVAGGKFWWWAMLFPAFGCLGSGISDYLTSKRLERQQQQQNNFVQNTQQNAPTLNNSNAERLPPKQTEYVSPATAAATRYQTGELVAPPSVVENTTRHLEMNSEGETMTLPKK